MPRISFSSQIPVPRHYLWEVYSRPGMFERLTPPWQRLQTVWQRGGIAPGDERMLRVKLGPVWTPWHVVHHDWEPGWFFSDEQVRGPFRHWFHRHRFDDAADGGVILTDDIEFELPPYPVASLLGEAVVRQQLRRMFRHRHRRSFHDVVLHHRYVERPRRSVLLRAPEGPLKRGLTWFLRAGGHSVSEDETRPDVVILVDPRGTASPTVPTLEGTPALAIVVSPAGMNAPWPGPRADRIVWGRVGTIITGEVGLLRQVAELSVEAGCRGKVSWSALDDLIGALYT
ncbi:MAG: SRPBCC family protein, partial [Chloroflexota bacterium]